MTKTKYKRKIEKRSAVTFKNIIWKSIRYRKYANTRCWEYFPILF